MAGAQRIQSITGMNDLFEDELHAWRWVEERFRSVFVASGYGEIRTPVLEEVALFVRSVGESSDIVHKEMFAFEDAPDGKKDKTKTVVLRPENTAGVVRALVQHGKLPADAEAKVFYLGPQFRRERPQKGRYRQFFQLGAEAFGLPSPSIDVELMATLAKFFEDLGLTGVRLVLNSLGDAADRPRFTEALTAYFMDVRDQLSEDSQRRLEQNPLRILDSKDSKDQELAAGAPKPLEYLGDEARRHFEQVTSALEQVGVKFEVNSSLVRGLDYYTRTVFEVLADTGLGAQNAVAAGGRYDNLVESLGGRSTPGVGFAAGVERILLLLQEAGQQPKAPPPTLWLGGADEPGRLRCLQLALELRRHGISAEVDHRERSVKAQLKRANRAEVTFTAVVGDQELATNQVGVKNMATGDVHTVPLSETGLRDAIRGGHTS